MQTRKEIQTDDRLCINDGIVRQEVCGNLEIESARARQLAIRSLSAGPNALTTLLVAEADDDGGGWTSCHQKVIIGMHLDSDPVPEADKGVREVEKPRTEVRPQDG